MKYAVLILSLFFFSCSKTPNVTFFKGLAMTMPYCIKVGAKLEKAEKEQIQKIIEDSFHEIDGIYNNWNPNSEVSKLNALNKGESRVLSNELVLFFEKISKIYECSQGRFDPCVGNLILAYRKSKPIPLKGTWEEMNWDRNIFMKPRSDLIMDFCGASKGYAIDLIAERLLQKGYANFYVEWAGEIRTHGQHPDKRCWAIQIRPSHHVIEPISIELKNAAIATSGPTQLESGYTHIVNPSTGKSIALQDTVIVSVSVRAPTCMLADGLATATMTFTDYEKAKRWAEKIVEEYPEITIWIYER